MSSYVLWANKGGIGKSTLSFQLACQAARDNPTKLVYVIDLSPQCDVSRMLLGGGKHNGEGVILGLMSQTTPRKTVQGYLQACLNDVPSGQGWPNPRDYVVSPNQIREPGAQDIPANVRLICGDFDLERTIQLIDQFPQPPRRAGRAPTGPEYSAYLLTRSFIKHAVKSLERGGRSIVFIDTDPYFNVITTHMGLVGAENWITAYSPSSQASQYAVMRSIEFMFDKGSGLVRSVSDAQNQYTMPWFDNRGNPLIAPKLSVSLPFLLIANMVNPYRQTGNQAYSDPQLLHRSTISRITQRAADEAQAYDVSQFVHHEHMWDMRRLGLLCDFNGIELASLVIGQKYADPSSGGVYTLRGEVGLNGQVAGYQRQLANLASII
jgi:Mrp family chromosome partitioning ATPase